MIEFEEEELPKKQEEEQKSEEKAEEIFKDEESISKKKYKQRRYKTSILNINNEKIELSPKTLTKRHNKDVYQVDIGIERMIMIALICKIKYKEINRENIYKSTIIFLKMVSPKWKNISDKDLLESFKKLEINREWLDWFEKIEKIAKVEDVENMWITEE